jgi:hypothetical protein
MSDNEEVPLGPEYTYCDKLILSFGNKESVVFDKAYWLMHQNGLVEVGVRETRREERRTINQLCRYTYKLGDIFSIKQVFIDNITEVEPVDGESNVISLTTK